MSQPQITSKLEINLLNANTTPQYVANFATKYGIQAIVASPEYIAPLMAYRAMTSGSMKIVCALDFPKGANYAMDKLFRANPDFVTADGFEILLSTGKTEIESKNEMKAIYSYLKGNRPMAEIRWVLRMHTAPEKETAGILKNMKLFPPSYVRMDQHVVVGKKADVDSMKEQLELIRSYLPYPIKVSGSVDLSVINSLKEERNVKKFDVTIQQAEIIARELKLKAGSTVPKKHKPGPAVKHAGVTKRIRI